MTSFEVGIPVGMEQRDICPLLQQSVSRHARSGNIQKQLRIHFHVVSPPPSTRSTANSLIASTPRTGSTRSRTVCMTSSSCIVGALRYRPRHPSCLCYSLSSNGRITRLQSEAPARGPEFRPSIAEHFSCKRASTWQQYYLSSSPVSDILSSGIRCVVCCGW